MKLAPMSQQSNWIKIIVYGDRNSGKTTFAVSGDGHEDFGRTVVANVERGLSSVKQSGALQTPLITSMDMMEEAIISMKNRNGDFSGANTLVLDSITELQRVALEEILEKRTGSKSAQPTFGDWNQLTMFTTRIGALLRDLECHVVITALAKRIKEKDGSDKTDKTAPMVVARVLPYMTEKAGDAVMGMFDNIWSMHMNPAELDGDGVVEKDLSVTMLTKSAGVFEARVKDTAFSKALPFTIENPTLPMVAEIYKQALTGDEGTDNE